MNNTDRVVDHVVGALQDSTLVQSARDIVGMVATKGDSLGQSVRHMDYASLLNHAASGTSEVLRDLVLFLKQSAPVVWEVMRNKIYAEMWVCAFSVVSAWLSFVFVMFVTHKWVGNESGEKVMGLGMYKWGVGLRVMAFVTATLVGMVYAPTLIRLCVATDYYTVGAFLQLLEKVR